MENTKSEIRNSKQIQMEKNNKQYDLEDRTKLFAKNVRSFVSVIPKTTANFEDSKQVIRSSGSIGANYIEANEALSKKDFLMRIKISRKEAKETAFWLDVINSGESDKVEEMRMNLLRESRELMMIFGSILRKSSDV